MADPKREADANATIEVVASKIDLVFESAGPSSTGRIPGLGWTLTDEAAAAIQEIEDNIRVAEQVSVGLIVGQR